MDPQDAFEDVPAVGDRVVVRPTDPMRGEQVEERAVGRTIERIGEAVPSEAVGGTSEKNTARATKPAAKIPNAVDLAVMTEGSRL